MELVRFARGSFAACGRRVPLPMAARRHKVHSTPFPPVGENCVRSLAPRKLRSFPCSSSSRRIRFAGLRREQRGIGQNAPGVSSGWALTCPYSPTPDPITGDALLVGWSGSSGAQNLSEHLNSRRATGPWVCKIYSWCGSTAAPGVVEPTIRCMCCRRGDPCSRLFSHAPRCLQGTASVQIKTPRAGKGSGRIKRSVVPPP